VKLAGRISGLRCCSQLAMPPSGRGGRKLAKIRAEDNDEDTEELPLSAADKKAAQVTAEKSAAAAAAEPLASVSPVLC
jgi:hypothetical protein